MNYVLYRKELAKGNPRIVKQTNDLIYDSIMSALTINKPAVVDFASKYIHTIDMSDDNDTIARAIRSFLKRHKPFARNFVTFMQRFRDLDVNKAVKKRNANGSFTWEQSTLGTNVKDLFNLLGNNSNNWSNALVMNDEIEVKKEAPKRFIRVLDANTLIFAGCFISLTVLIIKNKRK